MSCHRLKSNARPAPWWHRLYCARCRDARAVDSLLAFGVQQLRQERGDFGLMQRAKERLDVTALGHATRQMSWRIGLRKIQRRAAKFGAFMLAVGGYSYYISLTPPLNIPPRAFPHPNAYDYFHKAATQLNRTDPKKVKMVIGGRGWSRFASEGEVEKHSLQNIRRMMTALAKGEGKKLEIISTNPLHHGMGVIFSGLSSDIQKYIGPSDFPDGTRVVDDGHTITVTMENVSCRPASDLEKKRELVRRNAAALATMHEGLNYPYTEKYIRAYDTKFPNYAGYKEMARLLAMDAQVKTHEGDIKAAVNDCLDATEIGQKSAHGGPLIGALVGMACQSIGRQPLWKLIPRLNAEQAKAALRRMQTIEAEHAPFADVMQEEHWLGQTGLHDLLRHPFWRFQELGEFAGNPNTSRYDINLAQRLLTGTYLMAYSNRRIWNNYLRYSEETVARARMSYPDAIAQPEMPEPDDPICRIICPVFAQTQFQDVKSETQNTLLLTTLALQAYAAEHNGQYPNTLDALVPGYLNTVPQDLFARHEMLRYRAKSIGTYLLYSVGPDGKDDGGQAIDNATRPSRRQKERRQTVDLKSGSRFMTMPDSEGDIVVGVTDLPNPAAPKNQE